MHSKPFFLPTLYTGLSLHLHHMIFFWYVFLGPEPTPITLGQGIKQFKEYVSTDICVGGRIPRWSPKIPAPWCIHPTHECGQDL